MLECTLRFAFLSVLQPDKWLQVSHVWMTSLLCMRWRATLRKKKNEIKRWGALYVLPCKILGAYTASERPQTRALALLCAFDARESATFGFVTQESFESAMSHPYSHTAPPNLIMHPLITSTTWRPGSWSAAAASAQQVG